MRDVIVEVCCGSLEDAILAEEAGADRVELNSAIFLGGLTPSCGTMDLARERTSIKTICMIRPREGGFDYSDAEFEVMKRDLGQAKGFGFEGVVFGCVDANGDFNLQQMDELSRMAEGMEVVCHLAFDVVRDTRRGLEQLIDMGFTRVLTTGRKGDAFEAKDALRALIEQADGRIQILCSGGLQPHNLSRFLDDMPVVREVHIGPFAQKVDTSTQLNPEIHFGGPLMMREDRYTAVSEELMARFGEWRNQRPT